MAPADHSPSPDDIVDVTVVIRTNQYEAIGGTGGCYKRALGDRGISSRSFAGIDLPNGFQTETQTLTATTKLLVIGCLIESGNPGLIENNGKTTGLKLAEEMRKTHPDLPIWLLDPPDEHGDDVKLRARKAKIDILYLWDNRPTVFAGRVKELLGAAIDEEAKDRQIGESVRQKQAEEGLGPVHDRMMRPVTNWNGE